MDCDYFNSSDARVLKRFSSGYLASIMSKLQLYQQTGEDTNLLFESLNLLTKLIQTEYQINYDNIDLKTYMKR